MLLVVDYPIAVGVLSGLVRVLRDRQWQRFVVLEVAMFGIVGGWWIRGQAIGVLLNGAALVAFAVAWWVTGRMQPRQ